MIIITTTKITHYDITITIRDSSLEHTYTCICKTDLNYAMRARFGVRDECISGLYIRKNV